MTAKVKSKNLKVVCSTFGFDLASSFNFSIFLCSALLLVGCNDRQSSVPPRPQVSMPPEARKAELLNLIDRKFESPEAHFQLGQMYYNQGKYELAYRYLNEANLQPFQNGELWVDREKHTDGFIVLDLLAMTCWKLRKFEEGLRITEKLLEHPRLLDSWKARITENKRWFEKNVKR